MSVQPLSQGPAIQQDLYDFIDRRLYYETDSPVTMRIGLDESEHFTPQTENAMPSGVLGLPKGMMLEHGMTGIEDNKSVYIVDPDHASVFDDGGKPDPDGFDVGEEIY